jgi:response regulator RpfG family c-di-GMP phosphodiesterase
MKFALKELRRERGRQFAPEVVDAVCRSGGLPLLAAA